MDLEFGQKREEEAPRRRGTTLIVSVVFHAVLLAILAYNPDLFNSAPKRIIRIAGMDFDLDKTKIQDLYLPPAPRPRPSAPEPPLVQPPPREMPSPQPPPPPPPPPPQQPPAVISPEDVIAEGARPDAQPKASRGTTEESARVAGGEPVKPPVPKPPEPSGTKTESRIDTAMNTNPNALRLPNLMDRAGRIVDQTIEESTRRSQRPGNNQTGLQNVPENPNFSTEEPTILSDTKGYDFGPYMNQVINRVRVNWYSLIPEIARLGRKGRVVVIFTITENGTVQDLRMVANSGLDPLDRAAAGSIQASNPFPKLPSNFDGDHLVLQFTFLYNLR